MSNYTCPVCDKRDPAFAWTDTHGIAQCFQCGSPVKLYHYEDDKRVEKAPECVVRQEWIPILRRYRADTGRLIPGGHSFPGGQELARASDIRAWNKWCEEHESELPRADQESGES